VTLEPKLAFFIGWPGSRGSNINFRFTNRGTVPVQMFSIKTVSADEFVITRNACATMQAAGKQCSITVQFRARHGGAEIGTLTVTDSATGGSQKATLVGFGFKFRYGASQSTVERQIPGG
jgi:hypothetical protein